MTTGDKPVASYSVESSHLLEKLSFVERRGLAYGLGFLHWRLPRAGEWLKDRKERQLSFDDIVHYQRVVGSVGATGLMQQKDKVIGAWPLQ